MRVSFRRLLIYLSLFSAFYVLLAIHNLTVNRDSHFVLQNIIFEDIQKGSPNELVQEKAILDDNNNESRNEQTKTKLADDTFMQTKNTKINNISHFIMKFLTTNFKAVPTKPLMKQRRLTFNEVLQELKNELSFRDLTDLEIKQIYRSTKKIHQNSDEILQLNESDVKEFFPPSERKTSPNEDRILKQMNLKLPFSKQKQILLWDSDLSFEKNIFNSKKCLINTCSFTYNRDLLYKNEVDAVIFKSIPDNIKRVSNLKNQVWIFYQLESSLHSERISKHNFVNWTATYRSDSVITAPYEKFVTFANISDLPKYPIRNYAYRKKKLVAWFVSNCGAENGRSEYVKELKHYIKVDIYGYCGTLHCKRGQQSCFEKLRKEYKFYLAFENSNCRDYITEKFFVNALSNDVVPVVMGAHPDDYKKLAPPKSYIHVDQFEGPRQLAEYLHILDANDDLYNSYFRWKETGSFIDTKFPCRLCSMLQIAYKYPFWYKDLGKWWHVKENCLSRAHSSGRLWTSWRNHTINLDSEKYVHRSL